MYPRDARVVPAHALRCHNSTMHARRGIPRWNRGRPGCVDARGQQLWMPGRALLELRHCGFQRRTASATAAIGHRDRRRPGSVRCGHRMLAGALRACRVRAAGFRADVADHCRRRPRQCRPRLAAHDPQGVQERGDAPKPAADVVALGAIVMVVAVASLLACLAVSTWHSQRRCTCDRPYRSRSLDSVLHRPSLIGQRRAVVPDRQRPVCTEPGLCHDADATRPSPESALVGLRRIT